MTRLPALRLRPDHYENADGVRHPAMPIGHFYTILGEWGATDHYIALDIDTGQIVPGGVHLDRFEEIPEDEL